MFHHHRFRIIVTSLAITHPDIQISGDVRIHPQAVIAPGVILQATSGYYVAIAAGACIGAGTIIQAHGGNIEIHSRAIIGAGSLVIGQCTVGESACVGYGSTIFQAIVGAAALLPPYSLLGDTSRQGAVAVQSPNPPQGPQDPWQEEQSPTAQTSAEKRSPTVSQDLEPDEAQPSDIKTEVIPTSPETPAPPKTEEKPPVVGQVYINQLLMTLFPHQNSLNSPNNPE
ncbi:carbon dioxide concentrating mechanism protein [Synechococcus moorigangaii CMS01]|nr:carbon dioxide concentrating mechanism protein [Synechococcus moorigangaii CMS01]